MENSQMFGATIYTKYLLSLDANGNEYLSFLNDKQETRIYGARGSIAFERMEDIIHSYFTKQKSEWTRGEIPTEDYFLEAFFQIVTHAQRIEIIPTQHPRINITTTAGENLPFPESGED